MAKRVGAEDKKGPAVDPAPPGHNVTEGTFLNAVKEITAAAGRVKEANTALKSIRKKWKANGITLGVLDATVKMAEWSRPEVRDHFDVAKKYAEWLGLPTGARSGEQTSVEPALEAAREWKACGRTYCLAGKPCKAPDETPPENILDFTAGWHEADEEAWAAADGGGDGPSAKSGEIRQDPPQADETPPAAEPKKGAAKTKPSGEVVH